jgi:hypothetical protein
MRRLLLLVGAAAWVLGCAPKADVVDAGDLAFGEPVKVTKTWGSHNAAFDVDAGVDAGVRRELEPTPPPRVTWAERESHPIVVALKAMFNDDERERDRARRDFLAPPLQARYRAINDLCNKYFDDMRRNDRHPRKAETARLEAMSDLCEWDRASCGNGEPGAHEIIIEHEDATTATATVVKALDQRVPVRLALLDRWRITEIDCGIHDDALVNAGLFDAGVPDAP